MGLHVGLDASLKRTSICVLDETGRVEWEARGERSVMHPEMIDAALGRTARPCWRGTGSTSPWLARELEAQGLPVVVRAGQAMRSTRGR